MGKKKLISKKIKKNEDVSSDIIITYLFSNSLIKVVITLAFFCLGLILVEDVNKLSFISPRIFLVSSLVFLVVMILFITYLSYYKYFKNEMMNDRWAIKLFDAYDLLSFILMTVIMLFFAILFILTPTVVDGDSMNNSYYNNDRLLVWHLGYTPTRDDAVIIDVSKDKYPSLPRTDERFFIKRIVATEGDLVDYVALDSNYGDLYVNDELVQENVSRYQYQRLITHTASSTIILDADSKVISGYSIVLGDNRNNSTDSRSIGAIENSDIQGKVVFIFYSSNGNFGFPKNNLK